MTDTSCSISCPWESRSWASSRRRTSPKAAVAKGIPTLVQFFNTATAKKMVDQGTQADLLIGNNVLAQVPDLNDFVAGTKLLLKPDGVITMEFPHLLELIRQNQFDTIYHEHFSYFSFLAVERSSPGTGSSSSTWRSCPRTVGR